MASGLNAGRWLAAMGLFLAMNTADAARAQAECDSDSDCGHGYTCEPDEQVALCVVRDCDNAEGGCPEPSCEAPETVSRCEPVSDCDADSECAAGFVCHMETLEPCSVPAASCDGGSCDAPIGAGDCTTQERSACVPRASLPCQVDLDCGQGFECVEAETCFCMGSSGTSDSMGVEDDAAVDMDAANVMGTGGVESMPAPLVPADWLPSDAGVADEDGGAPMVSCGCEPSGQFQCVVIPVNCEIDGDCVVGTTCELDYSDAVCTGGVSQTPASSEMTDVAEMDAGPPEGEVPSPPQDEQETLPLPEMEPLVVECEEPVLRCLALPYGFSREHAEDAPRAYTGGERTSGAADAGLAGPTPGPTSLAADEDSNVGAATGTRSSGCAVADPTAGGSALALVGLALGLIRRRRWPQA